MQPFELVRPESVAEAYTAFLADEESRYLAGGMSLIPTMKLGLVEPSRVIDLSLIPGLSAIARTGDAIEIGALARHCDVARNPIVSQYLPGVGLLAGGIGDRQVRNRGTIGGSVANNDPAACYPSAILGLSATIKTNLRQIPASEFFLGLFETALQHGEMLTGFRFDIPKGSHYVKFHQKASRFALVGVFVSVTNNLKWRVAVTGASSHVFRVREYERVLDAGGDPRDFPGEFKSPTINSDIHASADYRKHLVGVISSRAVSQLMQRLAQQH
jgi:carbon-monoxide dehydrogenase medium subunit